MSIPYLVHKDDAEGYDAINVEMGKLREAYKVFECELMVQGLWGNRISRLFDKIADRLCEKKYDQLKLKYGDPRVISAFEKYPKDLKNYFTYYRGRRWGEAAGCEMTKIAQEGIEKCHKALSITKEGEKA